jgi:hypothetical protein
MKTELIKITESIAKTVNLEKLNDTILIGDRLEFELSKRGITPSREDFIDSIDLLEKQYEHYSITLEKEARASGLLSVVVLGIVLITRHIQINEIPYLSYGLTAIFLLGIISRTIYSFGRTSVSFYSLCAIEQLAKRKDFVNNY